MVKSSTLRSIVAQINRVTIGLEAVVVGVTLHNGAQVPDNTVVTTQKQAEEL